MDTEKPTPESAGHGYVRQFLEQLSNPIHKRVIEAYEGDDPVMSMESELVRVLREVLEDED
ncbi:MAG TPA: hypothetical protein VMW58_12145 [Anaerolineae bacterium]|nr:hypothetical protein [Anaerolineae bacterium]